ncbi:uncharacterized protein C8Q71DRAFT_726957 [Rhodofomes roseus]|uniref:Zn(2)-C6 fungal-type domain-containing protein n=1 Tax=Rhodofomes roseus TaxID=34475 RepID=A0ABQ8K3N9_9APHY|nr:uncharacterized protein C8Q71DRAFT_726957 [Rhodofomes roseus]KAH9831489.1 hypothetical protein C8Q71DRAFT_726957 [Rhodofomes roseus]
MVGTLTLGDFCCLQAAGFIGLPDYAPDHIDNHVLSGLDATFRSLVESPFDWHAIGNIAFHIVTNDTFMESLNTWIVEQGGEVQLPPWLEEFREWQYAPEEALSISSQDPSLRRRLITAGLWNDQSLLDERESKWTSNGWMSSSLGHFIDLGIAYQPEVRLAEWLAKHPEVECFPRAWCMSEDEDRSLNPQAFLDIEAEEDFEMQDDKEEPEEFEDEGEEVESNPEILVEGSVGTDEWYLNSRGQFFMSGKIFPETNSGDDRCLQCRKLGFTECIRQFSGSSCLNCRDRKVKCNLSGGVPGSRYHYIFKECKQVGFDLLHNRFVDPPSVDIPATPESITSALPPPSTATGTSRSSRRNLINEVGVADADIPVVLSMLRQQLTAQPDASSSGAGPGPSSQQHVNLQILNVLERINNRLDCMDEDIPVRRSVKKNKSRGKSKGTGKGKGRARDDMEDDADE